KITPFHDRTPFQFKNQISAANPKLLSKPAVESMLNFPQPENRLLKVLTCRFRYPIVIAKNRSPDHSKVVEAVFKNLPPRNSNAVTHRRRTQCHCLFDYF